MTQHCIGLGSPLAHKTNTRPTTVAAAAAAIRLPLFSNSINSIDDVAKVSDLVAQCNTTRMYSLHRIEPLKLFHRTTSEARAAAMSPTAAAHANGEHPRRAPMTSLCSLPSPVITFQPPGPPPSDGWPHLCSFASLHGGDESKVIVGDETGHTAILDAERRSVITTTTTPFHSDKGRPHGAIAIELDFAVYVMPMHVANAAHRDLLFEVLRFPAPQQWTPLPPPMPFVYSTTYRSSEVASYAVAGAGAGGAASIYVSFLENGIGLLGTYAFDTASCTWSRLGSWVMPFVCNGELVPELELWFGFTADHPYSLCVCDLSRASSSTDPPLLRYTWPELDDVPEKWWQRQVFFVNLGAGKFCVVKVFRTTKPFDEVVECGELDDDDYESYTSRKFGDDLAVFTGVEVVRSGSSGDDGDDELEMVKHKSKVLTLDSHNIHWVL